MRPLLTPDSSTRAWTSSNGATTGASDHTPQATELGRGPRLTAPTGPQRQRSSLPVLGEVRILSVLTFKICVGYICSVSILRGRGDSQGVSLSPGPWPSVLLRPAQPPAQQQPQKPSPSGLSAGASSHRRAEGGLRTAVKPREVGRGPIRDLPPTLSGHRIEGCLAGATVRNPCRQAVSDGRWGQQVWEGPLPRPSVAFFWPVRPPI